MSGKKVTSSDVAKRAGVSQATVSMVLNKKYNVSFSKDVIQKVEEAAQELGYELPKRKKRREERRQNLLVVISRISARPRSTSISSSIFLEPAFTTSKRSLLTVC